MHGLPDFNHAHPHNIFAGQSMLSIPYPRRSNRFGWLNIEMNSKRASEREREREREIPKVYDS